MICLQKRQVFSCWSGSGMSLGTRNLSSAWLSWKFSELPCFVQVLISCNTGTSTLLWVCASVHYCITTLGMASWFPYLSLRSYPPTFKSCLVHSPCQTAPILHWIELPHCRMCNTSNCIGGSTIHDGSLAFAPLVWDCARLWDPSVHSVCVLQVSTHYHQAILFRNRYRVCSSI